jgi:acetamidase/formamidase
MTVHYLDARGPHLHGHFSREFEPVLTVEPGDSVRFETLDCWWSTGPLTDDDVRNRPRVPEHYADAGHALTGPVEIAGATAGGTLAVRVDAIRPGRFGTTLAGTGMTEVDRRCGNGGDPAVLRWELDAAAMTGRTQHGNTVGLRPFMGVLGLPPDEAGRHSTIPPRNCGGNLDCKELVVGSTLYLPLTVDGGLFSVGDGHAAQGDGEVGGTAIECPMTVQLSFDIADFAVSGPVANTGAGWVTMGLGDTLDEASFAALNAMFDLLERLHGVSRADATALASVVVDLRVTQVVNQTVGVHAVLPHGALR